MFITISKNLRFSYKINLMTQNHNSYILRTLFFCLESSQSPILLNKPEPVLQRTLLVMALPWTLEYSANVWPCLPLMCVEKSELCRVLNRLKRETRGRFDEAASRFAVRFLSGIMDTIRVARWYIFQPKFPIFCLFWRVLQ
jgi:hypothetical protein